MNVWDFYGRRDDAAVQTNRFVLDGWVGPGDAPWEARIIGAQEYRLNIRPFVIDQDGHLLGTPTLRIAHVNPSVLPESQKGRGVLGDGGMAEYFTLHESMGAGINLGGGSKILEGQVAGPDVFWVVGNINGQRVRSQRVRVGVYGSDLVLGPIFMIVPAGDVPPSSPAGTPSTAAIDDIARAVVRRIGVTMQVLG